MKRIVAFAVLLLLVPVAAEPSGVRETRLGVAEQLAGRDYTAQDVSPGAAPGVSLEGCTDSPDPETYFSTSPDGRGLRFAEAAEEHGCAVASYTLSLAGPASDFELAWAAHKTVYQATGEGLPVGGVEIDTRTLVNVYDDNGDLVESQEFLDRQQASHRVEAKLSLSASHLGETRSLRIDWIFIDHGPSVRDGQGVPIGGQRVVVDITSPLVTYTYPATGLAAYDERVDVGRDKITEHIFVPIEVPAHAVSVAFQVSNELSVHHVQVPGGRYLSSSSFAASEDRGVLTLKLDADALEAYGPGNYIAVFQLQTTLEPTPFLVPLIGGIIAAPAVLGIFASRSAAKFTSAATDSFTRAAKSLRFTLAFWWAVYLGAVVGVVALRMWPLIVSWPIEPEAAMMHGLFVLVSVAFVALGFYWRRQLSQTMEEELAQKERAFKDLLRSNEELQQFAYVASHDLQEPLRTVSRFTQLLEHRYADKLDKDAKEFMAFTVDGARRMQSLIDDLLRFSRIETRGKPLAPVDLGDVVDRAVRSLTAQIEDTGGKVQIDSMPTVLGDEVQLGQVFQNLVANALKFSQKDKEPRIKIGAEKRGKDWVISVKDNGIGIAPEHFERIFVVFQRLHGREEYEGTGIGLSLCKKIVGRHGGRIWLESKPGRGTTFFLSLLDATNTPQGQRQPRS